MRERQGVIRGDGTEVAHLNRRGLYGQVTAFNHAEPEVTVLDVDGDTARIALASIDLGIRSR